MYVVCTYLANWESCSIQHIQNHLYLKKSLQTGFKTGLACAVRKMTHKFLGMIHTIVIYGENKQEFHRGVTIE